MEIAALVSFAVLFVAWIVAPNSRSDATPATVPAPEALPAPEAQPAAS